MKKTEQYLNNPKFRDFVSREFDTVVGSSTVEEMAEFAFGDLQCAINKFKHKTFQSLKNKPK